MAIVRAMGKPDYFITFTTYPKWMEIQTTLFPRVHAQYRPDIACRVFKIKLDALHHDLQKRHVLGKVVAYTLTIECQKRGLTHAHILLIMANRHKSAVPEIIDKEFSAELPDKH
uniref:Helitron helicase-like domain-containing protein n=1 Tax=Octopus bimaculoides TaxID=37653 RepID=A0A0L8HU24_OCTBM